MAVCLYGLVVSLQKMNLLLCHWHRLPVVVVKIQAFCCFHKLLFIYRYNRLEFQDERVGWGELLSPISSGLGAT